MELSNTCRLDEKWALSILYAIDCQASEDAKKQQDMKMKEKRKKEIRTTVQSRKQV